MSNVDFVLNAETRNDLGKGASRRLRRQGKVPGVIYGAHQDAVSITVDHNDLWKHLQHEAFYSHILTINIDGKAEQAVLKDLQRHPAKALVMHLDLLRVSASEKLRMNVPLHFTGGDVAPGVKVNGGLVTHNVNEVEVLCLPQDLPEFITVDLSGLELGHAIHLSQLQLPAGVELVELSHGNVQDHDFAVAAVVSTRASSAEGGEAAE